jgi:TonB-dependent receptor
MKKTLLIFLLAITGIVNAQKGTIRGTVIENESGLTVIGANVVIPVPLSGVSTDLDGQFSIAMESGTYTVKISFISFQTVIIENVIVKVGEVTTLGNIRLKSASISVDEVVITATATRKSESALNSMKKKSATMMDGISAQKMAMTGDGSAAEAAQRVTGVSIEGGKYIYVRGLGDRYSKVTLNGTDIPGLDPDKNSLQMDIFPTALIDNIIVSKNFTADLPANFTGGLVNIETKSFPDEKIVSASFGISYNPGMHFNSDYLTYEGGKTDFLGFDDGTRALSQAGRGTEIPTAFARGYTDEDVNEFNKEFNPTLGAENQTSLMDYSASFTIGNQIQLGKSKENQSSNRSLGYMFSLSYKSQQSFYDDITYGQYVRADDPASKELVYGDLQTGQLAEQSNLVGLLGGLAYKTKLSKYKINLMHLQNGTSSAGQFLLDQNSDVPGRSGFTAASDNLGYNQQGLTNLFIGGTHVIKGNNMKVEWKLSPTYSSAFDPDIRKTAFTYAVDTSFQAGNAGVPSRLWRELNEFNVVAKGDVTYDHQFLDEDAKLKFGFSGIYKQRDYEIFEYSLLFASGQSWNNIDPNEVLDPSNLFPNRPNGSYHVSFNTNEVNPNQYNANSRNIAVYVSEEFNLNSNLKAIVGVRIEDFELRHTGRDINAAQNNGGNSLKNEVVLDGTDLFPSVNFIYSLAEEMNLRAGYSKTIARPSFKELSFAQIVDPVSNRTFNGGLFSNGADWDGNLTATNIDNFDVRWEMFLERGQIFSASAFYKRFQDPIELVRIPLNLTGFEYQPRNVGDGNLYGIELEFTKSLNFINESFKNFSLSGNVTLVKSVIEMTTTEFSSRKLVEREGEDIDNKREMAGQAPYVVNFGVSYTNLEKGISSGLFYNVKGPTLIIVGTGFVPDIYQREFHSLNWGISKKIGEERKTAIDFKVSNILNDKREDFFSAFEAADQIFTQFSPGTTISAGISHKF